VFNNLLKYLFGERDMVEVREDMEEEGVHKHLWFQMKFKTTNFFKPCSHFCVHTRKNNLSLTLCLVLKDLISIYAPT
jgi:hypothetical protein